MDDAHFEESKNICESVDHAHMAPPCRTLTKSCRSDEHGTVKVLRSEEYPDGWGDNEAVEANLVISRMVILCLLLHRSGAIPLQLRIHGILSCGNCDAWSK